MAGFKQLHPNLLTSNQGLEVLVFGFRINGTSNPDFLWQANANAVLSVVRTAAGRFTVTLNKPYPRELVAVFTQESRANSVTTDIRSYYVNDSYSTSAGTLEIATLVDDGTPAVGDPEDNTVIYVCLACQYVNLLVDAHA